MGKSDNVRGALLVGCPRSGTTLFQELISAHRDIVSISETHFFAWIAEGSIRHRIGLASRESREQLKRIANELEVDFDDLYKFPIILRRQLIRGFERVAIEYAMRSDAEVWIEKTPEHVYYTDIVKQASRDVRFVHLVRRGRDVVASLYKVTRDYPQAWGGEPWTVQDCIDEWISSLQASNAHSHGESDHFFVSYSSVVQSSTEVVRGVWRFLGLDVEGAVPSSWDLASTSVVPEDAPWQEIGDKIQGSFSTKFRRLFNQVEREYVIGTLREALDDKDLDRLRERVTIRV